MLRVTIDLVPGGDEERARTIGRMEIANIKTREDGTADYVVILTKTPPFSGALRAAWRKGKLTCDDRLINGAVAGEDDDMIVAIATGHHRSRHGVYDLLFRALCACGLQPRNQVG